MQEMTMRVREDDDVRTSAIRERHGAPKPEYIELNENIKGSEDLLYVLKKECLERKALTKVERLPIVDDAALRTLSWSASQKSSNETAASARRNNSSAQGARTVEKLRIRKEDRGRYTVSSTGSKPTVQQTEHRNGPQQGRVYFLSEKYEDVSGDESPTTRPLQSTDGVNHDVIERFLPLVDAMEQVVPTDGEDLPDDGGLVIDDGSSPARDVSVKLQQESTVRNGGKYGVSSCQTVGASKSKSSSFKDDNCRKDLSASTAVWAETSRTEGEVAKSQPQTTGLKAKKARTSSKARKPSALLEMLRTKPSNKGSTARGQAASRRRRRQSGSQRTSSNTQHRDRGSGSEVLTDEDSSSTTTIDGTEYQMNSDEGCKEPPTAEPDDARHGAKRTTRNAEDLRKCIVRDPLNEESGYNRLVQELPGFNWLEQKIMGHTAAPVKPVITKSPAAASKEATCQERVSADTREATIPSGADILSRSMSEIQDDAVFSEGSEVGTIIKCVSTQTELLPGCPTEDCVAPPVELKREPRAPDVLQDDRQLPVSSANAVLPAVLHCPPPMPATVQGIGQPLPAVETEEAVVAPPRQKSEAPGEAPPSRTNVSPGNSPDVMYLGVVERQLKSESPTRVPCSSTGNERPHILAARTEASLPQAQEPAQVTNVGTQQKAGSDAQRQVFPWFFTSDSTAPSNPAPPPLQGLADLCHQTSTVHSLIAMPEKALSQQYVTVAPQKPYEQPVVPHVEVRPRFDSVPLYPFLGFPQPQYYIPYTTSAQSRPANPTATVQQERAPANVHGQQEVRAAELRTTKDERHAQKNVPILPKPFTAAGQPPRQPQQRSQPRRGAEGARCPPVRRAAAKPDQGPPRRERPARPPADFQRTSPGKIAEYNGPPPLSVPRPQPQAPQDIARISPAVQGPKTPEQTEGTSTEQELLKRKDELKYLDHLAYQKEAEYDRLLRMRTEKLRILTELENKIKSCSESEKSHAEKDNVAPAASGPPYPHQEVRPSTCVYKEVPADRNEVPRPALQKRVTESQTGPPTIAQPPVVPQRSYQGLVPHYPVHPQHNATIPVVPPANIPMTVPLIGRGLFNVRSIDIPREMPPVMVHGNAALHPGQERRPDFHVDQRQHPAGHQTVYRSAPVKRAHSTDDVGACKQAGPCTGVPAPVQHHTIQRPFPQRAGKPPPLPEPRSTHWPMKENYGPGLADYCSHPSFPFQPYYHGKAFEASRVHQGDPRPHFGYFPACGEYGAGMGPEKFGHQPSQPSAPQKHMEREVDNEQNSTKKSLGVDSVPLKRCLGDGRVLYFHGRPLPRDVAHMPHPAVHPGRYEADPSRSQGQVIQGPHQQQAKKEESSKCACCGKYAQYLCSGCQSTWYCGQQCQRSNWTEHSVQCRSIRQ